MDMKNLFCFIVVSSLLLSCQGTNKNTAKNYSVLPDEEPTYLRDRRIEDYSSSRTSSHGSSTPGNGGSYASSGYRSLAIKDTTNDLQAPLEVYDQ